MKILVFCPTYQRPDGQLAIYPDTQASLNALEHGEHDVTLEISVSHSEDKENNVIQQYLRAEHLTRTGGYQAVLFIEHDMIVPADALVKLAAADGDIVYGVYMFRHGRPTLNAFREVAGPSIDQSLQNYPDDLRKAVARGVVPVSGLGFGCTLIHRHVFNKIHIRKPDNGHYPDGSLAEDARRAGLRQVAHFGVLCGHIRPDGYVLWPLFDGRDMASNMVKIRVLRTFNASLRGQSVPFTAGTEANMPLDEAVEYQRGGFVSILDSRPQVKLKNRPERILKASVK